jgi:hypothetical protein
MDSLLLGGWQHVAEDVKNLASAIERLPEACACGNASAHLTGSCPCCVQGERRLDAGCTNCAALLNSLYEDVDELSDASLRFLPFVEGQAATVATSSARRVRDVRAQIRRVNEVLLQVSTAAIEFQTGCSTSHLGALKLVVRELETATLYLNSLLISSPPEQPAARRIV